MKLFGYWRSSCSWRVRIGLELKGITYQQEAVHLLKDGGQQHQKAFLEMNPSAQVPVLVLDDGTTLSQSIAILEYLEEAHPEPPLLPGDPIARAEVRRMVEVVNSGIQPLQNLGVLQHLAKVAPEADKIAWAKHHVEKGLRSLELMAQSTAKTYLHGEAPGLADACLVPQLYNARRFELDLDTFPTLVRVDQACSKLESFERAHPNKQPDAVS